MSVTHIQKEAVSHTASKQIQKPFFSPAPAIQRQAKDGKDERVDNTVMAYYQSKIKFGDFALHFWDGRTTIDNQSIVKLEEANQSNVRNLGQSGRERHLLSLFFHIPFQISTSKPASNPSEDITPMTLAIADWQYNYIHDTTGKYKKGKNPMEKITGKYVDAKNALQENGFDPTGTKNWNWEKIDADDAIAVLGEEKRAKETLKTDNTDDAKRQAIVDLALTQVGTVVGIDRGDNHKIGWERIARYYEVAEKEFAGEDQFKRHNNKVSDTETPYGLPEPANTKSENEDIKKPATKKANDLSDAAIATSKIAGIKAANKFAFNMKEGDWSWCGIFTVWAIRSITGKGSWQEGPKGFGQLLSDLKNAKKGDIINIKITSNDKNHDILLAEDIPAEADDNYIIYTIEGNTDMQAIKATRRWKLSDVAGYYKTV